ncbi:Uridine-cytidine kinase [Actinidia chinensis var. chinensis]|uniref:Uridine-cytidine kinase n=1 Tax=Actinidia chinensis var. chinensis TaxID=1590841 RepID=A0A2R6QI75_ACTCC|nr:Uridine-cytidine kinase [Actinidia chinensis var. chinensis]
MALGYTIASILKRSSHVFFDDRVCVKTDWLEQLNRKYVQVQGRDRMYVKFIAEQLGLDGSYVPRTYIEQIQLEKLVNDVMALPADLKTKLSIDDDLVSSPKEALSRASADRRMKYLNRGISHSFSTRRDKNLSKLTQLAVNNRRYDGRTPDSPASLTNQGIITQLSEQISTLNERMDEFKSRIEELNSKYSTRKVSASQQNLALQAEACNDCAPTSLFMAGLNNGTLTGSMLPHSASSSQLAKESPLMEEVLLIARGQRQVMHQLDNLSNLLHEYQREKSREGRPDATSRTREVELIGVSLILTLAIGGLGIFLFRTLSSQK